MAMNHILVEETMKYSRYNKIAECSPHPLTHPEYSVKSIFTCPSVTVKIIHSAQLNSRHWIISTVTTVKFRKLGVRLLSAQVNSALKKAKPEHAVQIKKIYYT